MKFFKKLKNLFVKKRSYYPEEEGTDGEGKKAVSNKSGLKRFNYSYDGTIGGNNYSYNLKYENGVPVLTYESMEHPDYGEMKTEIGEDVVDTLNNIYLNLSVLSEFFIPPVTPSFAIIICNTDLGLFSFL